MAVLQELEAIARPIVESRNAYIIGIELRGNQGGKILELYIDTDEGVSTDLCAEVSREFSHALDIAGIITARYHLVVSSPGSDRPLKFLRQYRKHVGRRLTLKVQTDGAGARKEGDLEAVEEDAIVLRLNKKETVTIPFDTIVEAKVQTVW
jgi:ribosome maturation factor RimP